MKPSESGPGIEIYKYMRPLIEGLNNSFATPNAVETRMKDRSATPLGTLVQEEPSPLKAENYPRLMEASKWFVGELMKMKFRFQIKKKIGLNAHLGKAQAQKLTDRFPGSPAHREVLQVTKMVRNVTNRLADSCELIRKTEAEIIQKDDPAGLAASVMYHLQNAIGGANEAIDVLGMIASTILEENPGMDPKAFEAEMQRHPGFAMALSMLNFFPQKVIDHMIYSEENPFVFSGGKMALDPKVEAMMHEVGQYFHEGASSEEGEYHDIFDILRRGLEERGAEDIPETDANRISQAWELIGSDFAHRNMEDLMLGGDFHDNKGRVTAPLMAYITTQLIDNRRSYNEYREHAPEGLNTYGCPAMRAGVIVPWYRFAVSNILLPWYEEDFKKRR